MPTKAFPTKSNLMNKKRTLSLAELGYDLLERKSSLLVSELMKKIEQVGVVRGEVNDLFSRAYEQLQKANITLGQVDKAARSVPIDNGIDAKTKSIAGLEVPVITLKKQPLSIYYGLDSTNAILDEAYLLFQKAKPLTVKLAELENNAFRLANEIKKTKKRTNALCNIVIPNLNQDIKFISDSLEEKEREDFSRLKVIKKREEKV